MTFHKEQQSNVVKISGESNGSTPTNNVWETLNCPKFIVAPMVDASELAWRMLCRKHGAELCYTPMLHSAIFSNNESYRTRYFTTCKEDRPLIVQFCANDPDILVKAAKFVESDCDAVDINLGCPQAIAKRGHYGVFLQDEWELLTKMIKTLRANLNVPVTCKVRVYEVVEKSVEYAKMLEEAGCQMLTVHGRTKFQKGQMTGIASWSHIKAVREAVQIPVIANGNIQCLQDVLRCMEVTGCNGVMSAEGILHNPALFEGISPPVWEVALEYLDLVVIYPCPTSYVRGHLFKLLHYILVLPENADLRLGIAKARNYESFRKTVIQLKERYEPFHNGEQVWHGPSSGHNLSIPPWLCQPYTRISPEEYKRKLLENEQKHGDYCRINMEQLQTVKREMNDKENEQNEDLSEKKLKTGTAEIRNRTRSRFQPCSLCPNPVGLNCTHRLCRICCKAKCKKDDVTCSGHKFGVRRRRKSNTVPESSVIS